MRRSGLAVAICAALLALPAFGVAADGQKAPQIGTSSYSKGEGATVIIEVDVAGADVVTATIGRKGARKVIDLTPTKSGGNEATWSGQVDEYKNQCAPVTFDAKNAAGKTEQREKKVCVFGPATDDPAVDSPPGVPELPI